MSESPTTIHAPTTSRFAALQSPRSQQAPSAIDSLFDAVLQLTNRPPPEPPSPSPTVQNEPNSVDDAEEIDEPINAADESSEESSPESGGASQPIAPGNPCVEACWFAPRDPNPAPTTPDVPTPDAEAGTPESTFVPAEGPTTSVTPVAAIPESQTVSSENPTAVVATPETPGALPPGIERAGKGNHRPAKASPEAAPTTASTQPIQTTSDAKPVERIEPVPAETQVAAGTEKPVPVATSTDAPPQRERRGRDGERRWSVGESPADSSANTFPSPSRDAPAPRDLPAEILDAMTPVDPSLATAIPPELQAAVNEVIDAPTVDASTTNSVSVNVQAAAAASVAMTTTRSSEANAGPGTNVGRGTLDGIRSISQQGHTAPSVGASSTDRADGTEGRSNADAVDRARLVQRVTRAFQKLGAEGGTVRVRLHPPDLGAVKVEVQVEGNRMQAKLTAESEAARSALQEQIPELVKRLAEQGMQVQRVEVQTERFTDFASSNPDQGQPNQFQDRPSQQERRAPADPSVYQGYRTANETTTPERRNVRLGTLDLQA